METSLLLPNTHTADYGIAATTTGSGEGRRRRSSGMVTPFRRSSIIRISATSNFHHQRQHHHRHQDLSEVEEEYTEHSEEEGVIEVSTLELFSDLVVVVTIHIVSAPLEENSSAIVLGWYLIQVFMLWFVWHRSMLLANIAAICQQAECITHYLTVFGWMAFVLAMTQAFSTNNNALALQLFLVLRALQTFISYKLLVWSPKPAFVDPEQHSNMKQLMPRMAMSYVLTELLPLSIAINFLSEEKNSPAATDDDHDLRGLTAVMVSVALILSSLFWYACLHDQKVEEQDEERNHNSDDDEEEMTAITPMTSTERTTYKVSFNVNHLQERYELITLVFIGEICFAAGHNNSNAGATTAQYDSMTLESAAAALLAAFAAYLLIFVTKSLDQTDFWIRSVTHRVAGVILYVGLFCVIPAIGAGVVRVMTMVEQEDENDAHSDGDANGEGGVDVARCYPHLARLLCYASGTFLILSALMNLCNLEDKCFVKMTIWSRVVVRLACGIGCFLLSTIPLFANANGMLACIATVPSATFVCPLLMLISAAIEIWAVGSIQYLG